MEKPQLKSKDQAQLSLSCFLTYLSLTSLIPQMMKCLFIQNSAWLSLPHLFTSQTIRIICKVFMVMLTSLTIIYTLVTTTQEETKVTIVLGLCITLVLPSVVEVM